MAIVDIQTYRNLNNVIDGIELWNNAFTEAFNVLQNGDTLFIPSGEYRIRDRVELVGKDNITINCDGVIMPEDNRVALIGTLSLRNITNSTINNLTFDGNKNNLPQSNTHGQQSLLRIDNSTSVTFNNLTIRNTAECGLNSDRGLVDVKFFNTHLEEIGEHGFYFGGNGVDGIEIDGLYCRNIGLGSANNNRHVAVIKFRNKVNTDNKHKNIVIKNFEFISRTNISNFDRQFVQFYDIENASVLSGKISGEDTSIFGCNTSLDSLVFNNVDFDGRRVCYSLNKDTGWDNHQEITNHGAMKIKLLNSNLRGRNDYFTDISLYANCYIKMKNGQYKNALTTDVNRDCVVRKCHLAVGDYRFDTSKTNDCNVSFDFVEFVEYPSQKYQPLFLNGGLQEDNVILFNGTNVAVDTKTQLLINTTSPVKLEIKNSFINSSIQSDVNNNVAYKEVRLENIKMNTYILTTKAKVDKIVANRVLDMNDNRKDYVVKKVTINAGQTTGSVSFANDRLADVTNSNLGIVNDKCVEFTHTVTNNVVNLTLNQTHQDDVTFTVTYFNNTI